MRKFATLGLIAGAALALSLSAPVPGFSAGTPSVDCSKKANKDKPECKNYKEEGDEALYAAGYTAAKAGDYDRALGLLYAAKDQADPRIQTMIGYALRKQGKVDLAMGYYAKALATNPNLTSTRQYLGEAFLQKGEPVKAREQLAEIARRCGTACEDYKTLADEIAKHEKQG
jgi:predicted Zn-dependent protease